MLKKLIISYLCIKGEKDAALFPFDYITNIRIIKTLCNRCLRCKTGILYIPVLYACSYGVAAIVKARKKIFKSVKTES